jgi:hypothetical protein
MLRPLLMFLSLMLIPSAQARFDITEHATPAQEIPAENAASAAASIAGGVKDIHAAPRPVIDPSSSARLAGTSADTVDCRSNACADGTPLSIRVALARQRVMTVAALAEDPQSDSEMFDIALMAFFGIALLAYPLIRKQQLSQASCLPASIQDPM